ncbi:MAG: hypothetical protein HC908_00905 [Calothrix sp. SM1_7_51]|nr:hypothetical protein [Calothrix sp. SM1_7_51]
MSAKLKLIAILILSIFASAVTGIYISQRQASTVASANAPVSKQQEVVSASSQVESQVYNSLVETDRAKYKQIPLEKITSAKGSDPATLAMNAFEDTVPKKGRRKVEVAYPQPDEALVTITQINQQKNAVDEIRYRVELTTFGRSILVASPLWQIVWVGSQEQCISGRGNKIAPAPVCQ